MFITFEGGEGAGKTTQISLLKQSLLDLGYDVISTREPGGTAFGEQIRNWLLTPQASASFGCRAELLLFLAARVQHLEELILPALQDGKIVLCDRFNDSTVAYQGGARGLGMDQVRQLCDLACEKVSPDLTFFFDLTPEMGMSRIHRKHDRLESEGAIFHAKVRESFLAIARKEPERVHVIDATQSKQAVFASLFQKVESFLGVR